MKFEESSEGITTGNCTH